MSVCLKFLVTASFCTNRAYPEKKVGQHIGITIQNRCKIEYEDYCLNGECYYALEEDIVGCNCSGFYGRKIYVVDLDETL